MDENVPDVTAAIVLDMTATVAIALGPRACRRTFPVTRRPPVRVDG